MAAESEVVAEMRRVLGEVEKRLAGGEAKRTVERGVDTDERRVMMLLRTEAVRVEGRDEEKEQLREELAKARRDNAEMYALLEERKWQERAPRQVRMPEIPKLDLEGERRRRVKKETADKLRRLEDVLPRGFILKEMTEL